ncbi:MAG: translation initiation factor IF-3 [Micavibrio sp.]
MRRPERPQEEGGLNINEQIRARQVRLIGEEGEQIGVVAIAEALRMAEEAGLDLVEISPNAEPPVCKVLDYGKYKYEQQKKAAEARKKQKVIEVKELKFRPNIDEHDYQVKVKAARRFLEAGDKVKVTLRFRGREMAHLDLGMNVMKRVKEELIDLAKVEMEARVEGRQAIMVLMPLIQK